MSQTALLEELKKLTVTERLTLIETALQQIRQDLQSEDRLSVRAEKKKQLAAAAEALRQDYATDEELTAFTALDGEDFHA
jgi:hypothetical protein